MPAFEVDGIYYHRTSLSSTYAVVYPMFWIKDDEIELAAWEWQAEPLPEEEIDHWVKWGVFSE